MAKIKAPVLLIHGERDKVVPVRQSEIMFDELEDAKKPVKFIMLDKGDHYLSTGSNCMQALKEIDDFIKAIFITASDIGIVPQQLSG